MLFQIFFDLLKYLLWRWVWRHVFWRVIPAAPPSRTVAELYTPEDWEAFQPCDDNAAWLIICQLLLQPSYFFFDLTCSLADSAAICC